MSGLSFLHQCLENLCSLSFDNVELRKLKADNSLQSYSSLNSYLRLCTNASLFTYFFPFTFLFTVSPSCCVKGNSADDHFVNGVIDTGKTILELWMVQGMAVTDGPTSCLVFLVELFTLETRFINLSAVKHLIFNIFQLLKPCTLLSPIANGKRHKSLQILHIFI